MAATCPICERRRGKRFCPGLGSSRWAGKGKSETICAQCCGEQRETTLDCPAHCSYLQAAHRYEGERRSRPKELAFPKVVVDQDFLEDNQALLAGLSLTLVRLAQEQGSPRDPDILAAVDALARSYQTRTSGLYYEQKPETPSAQALAAGVEDFLTKYSQEQQQQRTGTSLRPGEILQALVFLRRLGQLEGNDRPLSRRYLEFLRRSLPAEATKPSESRLIIPGS
jgi:hypothetical protein